MESHTGGRLVIESRQGEGTTAKLWLRAAEGDAAPVDALPASQLEAASRAHTILAVDDEALVLMSTALMLQGLGHKVLSATSGQEALEILRRGEAVDLIFTDEAMPQMRGSQLAEAVHDQWPDVAVVLATGYAEPRPGEDARLPRLEKPFGQADLARVIDQVMRSRRR